MAQVTRETLVSRLQDALDKAPTPAARLAVVRTMTAKWEPIYPGIGRVFAGVAGLAKLLQGEARVLEIPKALPGLRDIVPIGKGGCGVVCRAIQKRFGRPVAVKIRLTGWSPNAEQRFDREQRTLARFHHTHIVPVHRSGRHGAYQYFVMKLIDGATLADVVAALSDKVSPPAAVSTLAEHAARTAETRSREKTPITLHGPRPLPKPADPIPVTFPAEPSEAYFRSVAAVIRDVADALFHAHSLGVVHRDVKPSNVMLDKHGVPSIIDFGLATVGDGDELPAGDGGSGLTQGALGTLEYMAPEQFFWKPDTPPDPRSDVWGLGATLYELLTLRRAYPTGAFEDRTLKTPAAAPPAPSAVCAAVPIDLEKICLKAMARDPAARHQTAADVADDLRRWLRGEATVAHPRSRVDRARMWVRRNPGWAGMFAAVVGCGVAVIAASFLAVRADAAEATAKAAEEREKSAKEREQDRQREALVTALQGKRLSRHTQTRWRDELLSSVREAAALRNDAGLRSQAVALLSGIDAVPLPSFPNVFGSSLAFDENGRLLVGGTRDIFRSDRSHPTHLWDGTLNKPQASKQLEPGPVAFRKDGTALQLAVTPDDRNTLALWDVGGQKLVRHLKVPGAGKVPLSKDGALLALSPDGKFAAATLPMMLGVRATLVWDAESGAVVLATPHAATTLALAAADADGPAVLVAGDAGGRVTTWTLPDGKMQSSLVVNHGTVTALAVGRDVRRGDRTPRVPALRNRLLAVGSGTSRVSVWELESSVVRSFCHGSGFAVFALAFSPDGVTLASGGREKPRLWDVATGRFLLELEHLDYVTALAFAADGKTLACSGQNGFTAAPAGTQLWAIEDGRGTQTLRGMVGSIINTWWSPDGTLVAGVSHDWRLAVWDRKTGLLRHIFEVPEGYFVDNVGVAFSPDGRHLVYSAGRAAFRWDLTTGEQLNKWPLPEGLSDALVYAAADKLYLFRQETADPDKGPFGSLYHPKDYPRHCRIRNLLGPKPQEDFLNSKLFDFDVRSAQASAGAVCFVVEGSQYIDKKPVRSVRAFDAATGKVLWQNPSTKELMNGGGGTMDPAGEAIWMSPGIGPTAVLSVRTGKAVEDAAAEYHALGPPGKFTVDNTGVLRRRGENAPLFRLAIDDARPHTPTMTFDPSGTRAAWVTTEGAVRVCDLTAAQLRLAAVGLNW